MFLILKMNGRSIFINIHTCKQTFKLFLKFFNEFVFSVNIYRRLPNISFNEFLAVVVELFKENGET
jgi:hypothetical protein